MVTDELKRNIDDITARVQNAAARVGSRVTIVAATKTVSAELISAAVACGIQNVGENRVREYVDKRDAVTGAKWHFIGTLQRNKAKYLVGNIELIQSVNSVPLALEIDRLAALRGVEQSVLVEINAGGEASKTGVRLEAADELIGLVRSLKNVTLRGLMAVPPRDSGDKVYRDVYDVYKKHESGVFDILSVGMSGDYEKAISFGSNMVRLGTALFGARNYSR